MMWEFAVPIVFIFINFLRLQIIEGCAGAASGTYCMCLCLHYDSDWFCNFTGRSVSHHEVSTIPYSTILNISLSHIHLGFKARPLRTTGLSEHKCCFWACRVQAKLHQEKLWPSRQLSRRKFRSGISEDLNFDCTAECTNCICMRKGQETNGFSFSKFCHRDGGRELGRQTTMTHDLTMIHEHQHEHDSPLTTSQLDRPQQLSQAPLQRHLLCSCRIWGVSHASPDLPGGTRTRLLWGGHLYTAELMRVWLTDHILTVSHNMASGVSTRAVKFLARQWTSRECTWLVLSNVLASGLRWPLATNCGRSLGMAAFGVCSWQAHLARHTACWTTRSGKFLGTSHSWHLRVRFLKAWHDAFATGLILRK